MEINNDFFLEIWEIAKSYCPEAKRQDFAYQLLGVLEEYGVDDKDFNQLLGEDHDLDEALKRKGQDTEESDEYEYSYDEDEDEKDY